MEEQVEAMEVQVYLWNHLQINHMCKDGDNLIDNCYVTELTYTYVVECLGMVPAAMIQASFVIGHVFP